MDKKSSSREKQYIQPPRGLDTVAGCSRMSLKQVIVQKVGLNHEGLGAPWLTLCIYSLIATRRFQIWHWRDLIHISNI